MVDSSKNNLQGVFVGNPSTVRGHRASFDMTATHYFYAVKDNLVARPRDHADDHKAVIFCQNRSRITAVSVCKSQPHMIAYGDEKGKVGIVKFVDGEILPHKEHFLLTGVVNEILWSADGKCVMAIGESKGRLAAVNPESGSQMGDILGITATSLCGVFTPKKAMFSAGESSELLKHQGIPFKGQGTQIKHPHTGFIN
jgi:hypothetical protein